MILPKLAIIVVPKTALLMRFAIITKSAARISTSFSGKNPSFFVVQELQQVYEKTFEDNVIDQTESCQNRWTIGCSDARY